jgi:RHS repeat-associated protein
MLCATPTFSAQRTRPWPRRAEVSVRSRPGIIPLKCHFLPVQKRVAYLGGIGHEGPGANNLFQVARSDQSHSGAVVSGTTPGVSYTYADGASGGTAAYLRLTRVTYPTTATSPAYLYPAAGTIGDRLNRLDSIASDPTGTTKYLQYTSWLGAGTTVVVDHPAVTGGLSFVQVGTSIDMVNNFMEPTDWKWRNISGSVVFDRYLYGYDRVGNRVSRQNAGATARDEVAVFDGLNRLTKFNRGTLAGGTITDTAATFNQAWTLDSLGNWGGFAVDANGGANSFVTQARLHNKANEIDVDNIDSNAPGIAISGTGANWVDPAYDPNGNMRSGPKPGTELTIRQHYRWDAWNRLTTVLADNAGAPGTIIAAYNYDGFGRRIRKMVGSAIYDLYYNETWQEIEVRKNGNAAAYAQSIYDLRYIDVPAVRLRDTDANGSLDEILYFVQDSQFNATALINAVGSVIERYMYDSYGKSTILDASGKIIKASSAYDNQVMFTGRPLDLETGLYQFRNRYFDSSLGRFVNRDPLKYGSGMDLYCAYFCPQSQDPMGMINAANNPPPPPGPPSPVPPLPSPGPVPGPGPGPDHIPVISPNTASHLFQEAATKGSLLIPANEINDPKYGTKNAGDWDKYEYKTTLGDGSKVTVHYMKNKLTGETADFKLKSLTNPEIPNMPKVTCPQKVVNGVRVVNGIGGFLILFDLLVNPPSYGPDVVPPSGKAPQGYHWSMGENCEWYLREDEFKG